MKTAALLEKRKSKYFKVAIQKDTVTLRKLRIIQGVRRIGLNSFYLPFTEENTEFLLENDFEFNGAFKQFQKKQYEINNSITKIPKYKKKRLIPYNFQIEGVNYIENKNGLALIADVMGLGKTITALAWIQYRKDINTVLITCPSSLKINWQEEFNKWVTRKFKVQILSSETPYEITGDVVVVNYDILHNWVIDLKLTNFDVCIADEIHYCKSDKSLRTKAFKEITMNIPNRIGLTGTPIENDPMEIYYLVNLINKNIFPNWVKFIQRYCDAKQIDQNVRRKPIPESLKSEINNLTGKSSLTAKERIKLQDLGERLDKLQHPTIKVWKRNGFTNQKELHRVLKKHVMIRRTYDDVDLELPDKIYSDIHLALNNRAAYVKAENEFIQYVKEKFEAMELDNELAGFNDIAELKLAKIQKLDAISRAPALAKLQELKLLAAQGKIEQVINWIDNFLQSDEKLIVFAVNRVIVKTIMDAFPAAVKIDGSTTPKKRNEAVKSFQKDDKVKLFVGNIKAAGVGLTLTAANKVAIVQFPWNPGEVLQAEGRSLRIGQTKKVTVYKFIAKDTIEERIVKLLDYKQDEIDQIIDGKNIKYKKDLVKLLIESYRK